MKALGVLVMMALVIGAFTSIPNVSAIGDGEFTKAKGTGHLTFGSANGKVCGAELCNSKSIPQLNEKQVVITSSGDKASEVLKRALEGQEASLIINAYNNFKGINVISSNSTEDTITSNFNAYANDGFLNQEAKSTVVRTVTDETSVADKKKQQEEAARENYPNYLKNTYANPDHPIYEKQVAPTMKETLDDYCALTPEGQAEMIEKHDYSKHEDRITAAAEYCLLDEEGQKVMLESFTTEYKHDDEKNYDEISVMDDVQADLILYNLGFDIDISKIGICGPGTELVYGMCLIEGELPEDVNTDWADFWDTKEDKEVVLEQVIMTNGTEAIPVVDDMIVVEDGAEADTEPEGTQGTTGPDGSTGPEGTTGPVVEPVVEEIDTSVIVDGKTFKDQASADRFMALQNRPVEPVVEDIPVSENPRLDNTETVPMDSGESVPMDSGSEPPVFDDTQ